MKTFSDVVVVCVGALAAYATLGSSTSTPQTQGKETMHLGAFSVSLAVKNLEASRAFYQKLGFEPVGGEAKENWLILRNGTTTIGLFQGMFERNTLTFNPGWTAAQETLTQFADVRALQRRLKDSGLEMVTEADESSTGPASFMVIDPDGNPILVDQHVASPAR